MEESHYRALLEEVRNDVANAEQSITDAEQAITDAEQAIVDAKQAIEELATLEKYLLTKVDGGAAPARSTSGAKPAKSRGGSRPSRKPEPVKEEENAPAEGKGMQTVEFGPDGFPST
jgi:hypothetical protein